MSEIEATRRSRKKQNTHRAILHNAKVLFEQKGIGNVTIDEISESADVSRSTFFSHFASTDDLLRELFDEEVSDVFKAVKKEEKNLSISAVIKQLNLDAYPYPQLFAEVLMKGILAKGESNISRIDIFLQNEIEQDENYDKMKKYFTPKEISALITGAFFGLLFQKLIYDEKFTNPDETNKTIQKFIKYLENQEDLS